MEVPATDWAEAIYTEQVLDDLNTIAESNSDKIQDIIEHRHEHIINDDAMDVTDAITIGTNVRSNYTRDVERALDDPGVNGDGGKQLALGYLGVKAVEAALSEQ